MSPTTSARTCSEISLEDVRSLPLRSRHPRWYPFGLLRGLAWRGGIRLPGLPLRDEAAIFFLDGDALVVTQIVGAHDDLRQPRSVRLDNVLAVGGVHIHFDAVFPAGRDSRQFGGVASAANLHLHHVRGGV